MTEIIVPLRFNIEEVGKHVKSSKKRFTWEVSINSKQHSILLDFSFISGKVKVTVDRKILLENQLPANTSFQYPFKLDQVAFNLIQQGDNFELRINNKAFSHMYNQMKTNKEFKKYEDEIKDFKVNQNQFQAKKLTLSIGGVGGMKKKNKEQSFEQHTWSAFGQNQMGGFPSYFDEQTVSTSAQIEQLKKQISVKKTPSNLLDQDSGISNNQKTQKIQNILDFEAQIQVMKPQITYQTLNKAPKDDFSTMQLMFNTMNMGNPVQNKQQVVINSNEVDFFSSQEPEVSLPVTQPKIDFFSGMNSPNPVMVPPTVSSSPLVNSEFSTMQLMFATNNQNNGSNQGINFNTNSGIKSPQQQPSVSSNQGSNWNSQSQVPVQNNYSTMQNLFSTNSMGVAQSNPSYNAPLVQSNTPVQSNLNTQHFATQQMSAQNFGTSFNLNSQSFGTQNFSGQNNSSQSINFLNQQPIVQKPVVQQTSFVQPVSQPVNVGNINMKDFNSMQMLFQANSYISQSPQQNVNVQQSIPTQQPSMMKQSSGGPSPQFNAQLFSTGNGLSSAQSPNMMHMNTYSGSSSGVGNMSFGFDMNPSNTQAFSTSANISMKKPANSNIVPPVQTSNNSGDLI